MKELFNKLRIIFSCQWNGHDWTSNAEQEIPPTPEQLESVEGFFEYARMYCNRCGYKPEPLLRNKN